MKKKFRMASLLREISLHLAGLRRKNPTDIFASNKSRFIALCTLSFLCIAVLFFTNDSMARPKAPLECSPIRLQSSWGSPELYYRALDNRVSATDALAAEQLRDLILSLTEVTDPRVIKLLNTAMVERCHEARPLLKQLWDFESKYACSSCVDSRPPPKTALDINIRLVHHQTWRGLRLPVIAAVPEGRLGNLMGEYASVYALHKTYNVSAVMLPEFSELIRTHFKGISIPAIDEYAAWEWTQVPRDFTSYTYSYKGQQLAAAGLLGAKPFLFKDYPFEFFIFNAFREEIRREFVFQDSIVKQAATRLSQVSRLVEKKAKNQPITTVGVHVRLTDYIRHINSVFSAGVILATYERYLRRAANYFLDRYPNVAFVVTSDDIEKTRDFFDGLHLENVFVSQGSPAEDMCLLSLCDHTIVTFGSYGFWAAYLGRGATVYPDLNITEIKYPHTKPFYEAAQINDFVPLSFSIAES